ncbi:MAG: hypothetical protein AAB545_02505 [Patescibacteria group bacterium]
MEGDLNFDKKEDGAEILQFPGKLRARLKEVEKEIEERERVLSTCRRTIESEESEPSLTQEEIENVEKLKVRTRFLEESLASLFEQRGHLKSQMGR